MFTAEALSLHPWQHHRRSRPAVGRVSVEVLRRALPLRVEAGQHLAPEVVRYAEARYRSNDTALRFDPLGEAAASVLMNQSRGPYPPLVDAWVLRHGLEAAVEAALLSNTLLRYEHYDHEGVVFVDSTTPSEPDQKALAGFLRLRSWICGSSNAALAEVERHVVSTFARRTWEERCLLSYLLPTRPDLAVAALEEKAPYVRWSRWEPVESPFRGLAVVSLDRPHLDLALEVAANQHHVFEMAAIDGRAHTLSSRFGKGVLPLFVAAVRQRSATGAYHWLKYLRVCEGDQLAQALVHALGRNGLDHIGRAWLFEHEAAALRALLAMPSRSRGLDPTLAWLVAWDRHERRLRPRERASIPAHMDGPSRGKSWLREAVPRWKIDARAVPKEVRAWLEGGAAAVGADVLTKRRRDGSMRALLRLAADAMKHGELALGAEILERLRRWKDPRFAKALMEIADGATGAGVPQLLLGLAKRADPTIVLEAEVEQE